MTRRAVTARNGLKTADDVRSGFLRYFEERGHRVVKSSPLVPQNDPTLLFANAGMNQFKDVFLGRETARLHARGLLAEVRARRRQAQRPRERRASARHHTFFEMLGNFSFGDYFKQDAIAFAWEFLTRELGLAADRLSVTIFKGEGAVPRDDEAHGFWKRHVPEDRILELGMKDNFWAMGDTGPCGPCSEIHYFQGDAAAVRDARPRAESASGSPASAIAGSRSGTWCSCSTTATARASSSRCRRPASTPGWASSA